MLENIKLILNISDDSKDKLIQLYIDKFTKLVLGYCKLKQLNEALESFVEDKVVQVLGPSISNNSSSGGIENTGEVKAITRGDTRIEYNVGQALSETSTTYARGATLTDNDREYLDSFRLRNWRLL